MIVNKESLIEEIAIALHDGWWKAYEDNGWKFAQGRRNDNMKTHPHMKPYDQCPPENNYHDRKQAEVIVNKLNKLENLVELEKEDLAKLIHLSWVKVEIMYGRKNHEHIKDSWEKHEPMGKKEHLLQAKFIIKILESNPKIFYRLKEIEKSLG